MVGHVLVCAKTVPLLTMPDKLMLAVPVLLSVMVCALLVLPN